MSVGCITLCSLAHKTRRKTEEIKSLKCAYLKREARVMQRRARALPRFALAPSLRALEATRNTHHPPVQGGEGGCIVLYIFYANSCGPGRESREESRGDRVSQRVSPRSRRARRRDSYSRFAGRASFIIVYFSYLSSIVPRCVSRITYRRRHQQPDIALARATYDVWRIMYHRRENAVRYEMGTTSLAAAVDVAKCNL